jgi:hypothetical protein
MIGRRKIWGFQIGEDSYYSSLFYDIVYSGIAFVTALFGSSGVVCQ